MPILKNEDEHIVELSCDCGCGEGLYVEIGQDDCMHDIFLELRSSAFYNSRNVRKNIRNALNSLRGKDKFLTDIIVSRKNLEEFYHTLGDYLYGRIRPEEYTKDGWFVCPNCESEQWFNWDLDDTYCTNCGAHINDNIWRN